MLILIAGLSGSIGKRLTDSALDRGHQVRGLGRSPENAPSELRAQLEDFIITKSYYDIPAIDEAMKGVYAVVCAYAGRPELQLEGQLVLLWAAERAGIKVRNNPSGLKFQTWLIINDSASTQQAGTTTGGTSPSAPTKATTPTSASAPSPP